MIETTATVLVVDDDPAVGKVLGALLQQDGLEARHVGSGAEALDLLERLPFEVVVTDLRMPGMSGMDLLAAIRQRWPEIPVVMLTAHGSVQLAVEAMKAGAAEFVLKPPDRQEILFVVRKVLESSRLRAGAAPLPSPGIIGESCAMTEVFHTIRQAACTTATVLIRGESGTGKELVAQAIHRQGPRQEGPFVAIHCAALPENLLEAELFGYEKGAFTGAMSRKPGRVELADGGTLFLDEIGDISLAAQVKLLRLVQQREFERLGSTATQSVDVRIVAATHRDLEAMLVDGGFREDLFYRLNVVPIWLPPLRERADDVALLARHSCSVLGPMNDKPQLILEPEALDLLRAQAWPGNVRQLQNFIERLVVLSDGQSITATEVRRQLSKQPVFPQHSPEETGPEVAPADDHTPTLDSWLDAAERAFLVRTLIRCNNNRTQAARILGISRRSLYNKLQKHRLE